MINQQQRLVELQHQSKLGEHTEVPLSDIQQLPMYQTRNPALENTAEAKSIREKEASMMKQMEADLKENPKHAIDPITLCKVSGALIVVDGHHRTDASRNAGRAVIPARILEASQEEALMLATTLNNKSTWIPQGREEKSEKAWQAMLKLFSGKSWDGGWSARKFAKSFGVGSKTIDRMVLARKAHGEEALGMTWQKARASDFQREITTFDKLCRWVTQIDKIDPQTDHELEILIEMARARYSEYGSKEDLAERFAALHDNPKAFSEHLESQIGEF
jgi:transposase